MENLLENMFMLYIPSHDLIQYNEGIFDKMSAVGCCQAKLREKKPMSA